MDNPIIEVRLSELAKLSDVICEFDEAQSPRFGGKKNIKRKSIVKNVTKAHDIIISILGIHKSILYSNDEE
jgi:hypothetical protein